MKNLAALLVVVAFAGFGCASKPAAETAPAAPVTEKAPTVDVSTEKANEVKGGSCCADKKDGCPMGGTEKCSMENGKCKDHKGCNPKAKKHRKKKKSVQPAQPTQ